MAEKDYEEAWPTWLKEGLAGQYVEENHLDIERVSSMFKEFSDGQAGQLLFCALEDFKELSLKRLTRLNVDSVGYPLRAITQVQRIAMGEWFHGFLKALRGFDEQARESEPAPDITNYR